MILLKKYTFGEELFNSITHGIGVLMGGAVCTYFLIWGYADGSALVRLGLWIYLFVVLGDIFHFVAIYNVLDMFTRFRAPLAAIF